MKDLFEDAVGVAPPSTVDVDRLIARRKRIQWWQRAGLAGLVVSAVATIGVLTSILPDGGDTSPTGTPSASALPGNPVEETPDQRAIRYASALRAIMAERLSDITVTGSFDVEHTTRQGAVPAPESTSASPVEHHYTWRVTVTGAAGSAELSMMIRTRQEAGLRSDNAGKLECSSTPRGRESCEVTTGPSGEKIRRTVTDLNTYGTAPQILVSGVEAIHPDLTWVFVSCPFGGALGSPGGGQGEPVLTLDQLAAIATDPRLAW